MNDEILLIRMNICSIEDKMEKLKEEIESTEDDEEYDRLEEQYEFYENQLNKLKSKVLTMEVKNKGGQVTI